MNDVKLDLTPEANTDLPATAISVVDGNVILDFGKPVRFIRYTLPTARQFITMFRKAANILEREQLKESKANGRRVRTIRRRANSKKSGRIPK